MYIYFIITKVTLLLLLVLQSSSSIIISCVVCHISSSYVWPFKSASVMNTCNWEQSLSASVIKMAFLESFPNLFYILFVRDLGAISDISILHFVYLIFYSSRTLF
jgi:hypothetical protein